MNKIEIFGWQTDQRFDDWSEKFIKHYENDDETLYVSKETFHHNEDDGFNFDYKYCVNFINIAEFPDENENTVGYDFLMVVMPKSLHKSHIESICECCDVTPDAIDIHDVIDQICGSVRFGSGTCKDWSEEEEVVLKIANVFEAMDRMRGFYIDKPWNMIGSTGWDTLEYATKGTDLFKPTFERYKESKKTKIA